jgi:hypothetical protein
MQTPSRVARPTRLEPIHAFAPLNEDEHKVNRTETHAEVASRIRARAVCVAISSQAKPQDEALFDWKLFALPGRTAGGFLSLGLATLYNLDLLLP